MPEGFKPDLKRLDYAAGKREYMEDRSCIINDFRPLGTADNPNNAVTTLSGVFDGHLSAKAAEMAANNLHTHLAKGLASSFSLTRIKF